jgi:hypothetical protein
MLGSTLVTWSKITAALIAMLAACADPSSAPDAGTEDGVAGADASPNAPDAQVEPIFPSPRGEVMVVVYQDADYGGTPAYGLTSVWFAGETPRAPQTEVAREGACRLLELQLGDCENCNGWCAPPSDCIPYPTYVSAGAVTMSAGDWEETVEDHGGIYYQTQFDPDAISLGDVVRASAAGADFPEFDLQVPYVGEPPILSEPPLVENVTLVANNGEDLALRWGPSAAETRIWLRVTVNNHHGSGDYGVIECDAPDTGELVVPQAIVEGFPESIGGNIVAGPRPYGSGVLRRYRRTAAGELHLVAAAQLWFGFEHPKPE